MQISLLFFNGALVVSTITKHVFIYEFELLKHFQEVQVALVRPRLLDHRLILLVKVLHHRAVLVVSFVCDLLIANRHIIVIIVSWHLPVVVTHLVTLSHIIWLSPRCLQILLVAEFISDVELLRLCHWLALAHRRLWLHLELLVAVGCHVSGGIIGAHLAASAAEIAAAHRPFPLLPRPPRPALVPICRGDCLWSHARS